MVKTLPIFLVAIGLIIGCGANKFAIDPNDYENDLTEEAFRFLFDRFPHDSENMAYCVVWGYKVEPVPDRFIARFEDLKDDVVSISDVKQDFDGKNVTFHVQKDVKGVARPVALVQVVHLPSANDGKKTIEVAWTYKDQSKRELIAIDESKAGFAKFNVTREIPSVVTKKTEVSGGNR